MRWWSESAVALAVAGMFWTLPGLAGTTDVTPGPAVPDTLAAVAAVGMVTAVVL